MKTIVVAALLALSFTTGFTCSKNTPAPEVTPDAATTTETAPVDGTVAPDATPVPVDAAPADTAPTTESH